MQKSQACIAKNEEQYISTTKNIIVGEKNTWRLRFLDSCGFLQASLDDLVKNSVREDFEAAFKEFGESDMLLRKGVFPYEWFDDIKKLDETELPPTEAFHSSLTREGVSEKDYEHAQIVWKKRRCKTMRDYHDLYCKLDVLQLRDVFERQRARLMKTHGLDLLHFCSLPGFSWHAALKYTGQRLELIHDREMYDFIQRAMRGGISTITHRYAKANKPYMGKIRGKTPKEIMSELRQRTKNERQFSVETVCEYFPDFSAKEIKDLGRRMAIGEVFNPDVRIAYLKYLDVNNLYGWAMSQPLPVGGFEWMTEDELSIPIEEMPPCFIETDLEYPIELHDKFSELVPAPDKITPEGWKN